MLSFGSGSGHCWFKVIPTAYGTGGGDEAGESQQLHLPALFF